MNKQQLLDQIKADIIAAHVCPDLAKTAKNLVIGDGNPEAAIVFVGEAPGKNEDEQGKPFVGAAGRFLDELLGSVGLKRQDVYITNIVKYRPPENRDPLPEEKEAFWPYLLKQLLVIQPKILVTLGRHSMEGFLPGRKISQVHGQAKRLQVTLPGEPDKREELLVLPLFHPAAALYNGGMRQTLIDDFAVLPKLLALINKGKEPQ